MWNNKIRDEKQQSATDTKQTKASNGLIGNVSRCNYRALLVGMRIEAKQSHVETIARLEEVQGPNATFASWYDARTSDIVRRYRLALETIPRFSRALESSRYKRVQ